MLVLDTNHVKELAYHSPAGERLRRRLLEAKTDVVTTVVSVEEELRGVLARANRALTDEERILAYHKLMERVTFYSRWVVLSLDAESSAAFAQFRGQGIRIGTQDLRIGCIALAHGAMVLTRNTVDFAQVPGLPIENWLD
jgi:tRNA(fMet)-specific endonuclease VapC